MTSTLQEAYRSCAQITRREAGNFYYGIRLLPAGKRAALCAVYALARRIDDIGDGDLPLEEKLTGLAALRASVQALVTGDDGGDPVLAAVGDVARRHPVPVAAFEEIIDGVEMDLTGRRYATFEELVVYCRCVAGAVGRLCLGVFGSRDGSRAPALADALGIGLQQTNILRDIREDLGIGRVYLPKHDLDLFNCTVATLPNGELDPQAGALGELIRFEAARAWGWYDRGLQLLPMLDRRSAACCAAMAGIYHDLLRRIAADPNAVMRGRVSLPAKDKVRVAGRALVRGLAGHG
jgi:phytoene synthase